MHVRLIRSTTNLVVYGQSYADVPLFQSEDEDGDVLANLWTTALAASGASKNTIWAYAEGVALFRRLLPSDITLQDVVEADVHSFKNKAVLSKTVKGKPFKRDADTVNLALEGANAMFRFLAEKFLVGHRPFVVSHARSETAITSACPAVKRLQPTEAKVRTLTFEEFNRIRAANPIKCELTRRVVDTAFVTAWTTALRLCEVEGVCRSRVKEAIAVALAREGVCYFPHWSARQMLAATSAETLVVSLWPEYTKGKRGGSIAIARDVVKAMIELSELQGRPEAETGGGFDPVFRSSRVERYTAETLGRYWRGAAKAAGIDAGFHSLRHSWATRTLREFMERGQTAAGLIFVNAQLRHAKFSTTSKYVHVLEANSLVAAEAMAVNTISKLEHRA